MTPAGAEVMKQHGHTILVEKNTGVGSEFEDSVYVEHGAEIVETAKGVFDLAVMVIHVKEPLPAESDLIRKDQIVFTYLHLPKLLTLSTPLLMICYPNSGTTTPVRKFVVPTTWYFKF